MRDIPVHCSAQGPDERYPREPLGSRARRVICPRATRTEGPKGNIPANHPSRGFDGRNRRFCRVRGFGRSVSCRVEWGPPRASAGRCAGFAHPPAPSILKRPSSLRSSGTNRPSSYLGRPLRTRHIAPDAAPAPCARWTADGSTRPPRSRVSSNRCEIRLPTGSHSEPTRPTNASQAPRNPSAILGSRVRCKISPRDPDPATAQRPHFPRGWGVPFARQAKPDRDRVGRSSGEREIHHHAQPPPLDLPARFWLPPVTGEGNTPTDRHPPRTEPQPGSATDQSVP